LSGAQREYLARCHCGAVGARYYSALPPSRWWVRACQCSFCRAHDALSISDPDGRLEFTAAVSELLQRYRFGSGVTEFLLCRACGVYVGARVGAAERAFGIVNARALSPLPADLPAAVPMDYAAENGAQKLERRQRRWTPLMSTSV
jgi:hypothetical protein